MAVQLPKPRVLQAIGLAAYKVLKKNKFIGAEITSSRTTRPRAKTGRGRNPATTAHA